MKLTKTKNKNKKVREIYFNTFFLLFKKETKKFDQRPISVAKIRRKNLK